MVREGISVWQMSMQKRAASMDECFEMIDVLALVVILRCFINLSLVVKSSRDAEGSRSCHRQA